MEVMLKYRETGSFKADSAGENAGRRWLNTEKYGTT